MDVDIGVAKYKEEVFNKIDAYEKLFRYLSDENLSALGLPSEMELFSIMSKLEREVQIKDKDLKDIPGYKERFPVGFRWYNMNCHVYDWNYTPTVQSYTPDEIKTRLLPNYVALSTLGSERAALIVEFLNWCVDNNLMIIAV